MEICIEGLEVYGRHGVTSEERAVGGRYVLDLVLFFENDLAAETDAIEDTVDYGRVAKEVSALVAESSFRLLESLACAVAEDVLARHPVERVRVRVAKAPPPLSLHVDRVAVTVERNRLRS